MKTAAKFHSFRSSPAPLVEENSGGTAELPSYPTRRGEAGINGVRRRPEELGLGFPVDFLGESKKEAK